MTNIKKKNIKSLIVGLIALSISFSTNSILILLMLFYAYSTFVIYCNRGGSLSDPRLLLVGFFTFYSTFYSIRVYLSGISILEIDYDLIALSLKYQFLGLVVFVVSLNATISNRERLSLEKFSDSAWLTKKPTYNSEILIFFFLSLIVCLSLYFVFQSGSTSKLEANQSNPIKSISDISFWTLTVIAIFRSVRLKNKFHYDPVLVFFIFLASFYTLVTGERDIVFRVGFIALLIHFDRRHTQILSDTRKASSFAFTICLLISIAVLVPISQGFKAVLISESPGIQGFAFSTIFSNEFLSAGRNFYSLLLYRVESDFSHIGTDILRAFLPSLLSDYFDIVSTASWFGSEFRVNNDFSGSSGWGFTLIGQGYLVGGIFGVFFISLLYGLIIGSLYNQRVSSIYWYAFYLLAFTTSIYVIRADLANLLSQIFKVGGFSVLILFVSHRFFVSLRKR